MVVKREGKGKGLKMKAENGIPKALAMAVCAGCARKTFWKGDGRPLVTCPRCKEVWYCSEACMRLDAQVRK